MLSTELPLGILKPGPSSKQGYADKPFRRLTDIEYAVFHSAEGWESNIMAAMEKPRRRASWSATVLLDGTVWRHYPLESVTWASGGKKQNIKGFAVEFEGVKTAAITDPQVKSAALIFSFLREKCPNLGAPQLPFGFQEHRILTNYATECPSGRIRWQEIADILKEGDMALSDSDKAWITKQIADSHKLRDKKGHERGTKINALMKAQRAFKDPYPKEVS